MNEQKPTIQDAGRQLAERGIEVGPDDRRPLQEILVAYQVRSVGATALDGVRDTTVDEQPGPTGQGRLLYRPTERPARNGNPYLVK